MSKTSSKQSAVLDACVLYPAPIRDILLNIAMQELFTPFWSDKIHQEWTSNLLKKRPDIKNSSMLNTVKAMERAFPDATQEGFEHLISTLNLPDADDRHVLAAAVHAKADCIVTFNLKDFPTEYIKRFDIEVIHPDAFIARFTKTQPEKCLTAFQYQVDRLKNPPMTASEVLISLEKCELVECADLLRDLISGR